MTLLNVMFIGKQALTAITLSKLEWILNYYTVLETKAYTFISPQNIFTNAKYTLIVHCCNTVAAN
jgi:hypothetical protein